MDRAVANKSKSQIIDAFGIPNSKKAEGNYEEWYYDYGQGTVSVQMPTTTNTNVRVYPYSGSATARTNTYGGHSITRNYYKYVKITFYNDRATKWESQAVDFTIKEKDKEKTALAIVGSIVGTVIYILAIVALAS
jgi:hypothetical protein